MNFPKVIIAIDSSEQSLHTAVTGFSLADQLQAKVGLLFVVDSAKALGNVDAGIFPADALALLQKEASDTLKKISSHYKGSGLTQFMPVGHPAQEIIATAESWGASIIVMGTHGRTGLQHLLMGSVAEYVVRYSKIPVLVVPRE